LVLTDDLVIAAAAAVTTATLVVLSVTLIRYRTVVSDAGKSAQLAKNLWDAMNSRLSVQDTRIIDLMAKVEVYSVRKAPGAAKSQSAPVQRLNTPAVPAAPVTELPSSAAPVSDQGTQETESKILTALASGPKSSSDIRVIIDMSREHTARLMKIMYERGLVVRNDRNKPYVYEITEAGRRYLSGT
jgi:predicted transcriptional regulator